MSKEVIEVKAYKAAGRLFESKEKAEEFIKPLKVIDDISEYEYEVGKKYYCPTRFYDWDTNSEIGRVVYLGEEIVEEEDYSNEEDEVCIFRRKYFEFQDVKTGIKFTLQLEQHVKRVVEYLEDYLD